MSDPQAAATKKEIRKLLRKARVEHAAALPRDVSALVFHRPPQAVLDLIPRDAVIGLYRADPGEAPANAYARFFLERGHTIALPWLVNLQTPMIFRRHTDPYAESDLAKGYFNLMQGSEDAPIVEPVAVGTAARNWASDSADMPAAWSAGIE